MITKARYCEGETFAEFLAHPNIKNRDMWLAMAKRITIPLEISARVEALHGQWHLLVLSEDWCGDSVNIVPIVAKLTTAPGNGAPIGGLKVITASGWFAARPSGTEDIYKIYAESFRDQGHLERIVAEAQAMVSAVTAVPG